ncbi:MAG: C40 family peptidase [Actinomycetota bacterium]
MKTTTRAAAIAVVGAALIGGAATPASAGFSDVPGGYWAAAAIRSVATDRDWMRDYGTSEFRPEEPMLRRHLARAVVRAFAPGESGSSERFSDLPQSDPSHPFAGVAVRKGWMTADGGAFRPDEPATKIELDRALVRALGLDAEIAGLERIHTANGRQLRHPAAFAELVLALQLGLHFNHPGSDEWRELLPTSPVLRADGAYALWKASAAAGTSRVSGLARYRDVELPAMSRSKRSVVEFALAYVGYPYIYAAEWHAPTPKGYCCGAQIQGGFDCSGYVWWILRAAGEGYDNTSMRPYDGWALPQRSSRDMAKASRKRLKFKKVRTTDLMFFDGDGGRKWKGVDHVGIALGKGWMVDASSGRGGVGITFGKTGWYRENFVWGRRIVPRKA